MFLVNLVVILRHHPLCKTHNLAFINGSLVKTILFLLNLLKSETTDYSTFRIESPFIKNLLVKLSLVNFFMKRIFHKKSVVKTECKERKRKCKE